MADNIWASTADAIFVDTDDNIWTDGISTVSQAVPINLDTVSVTQYGVTPTVTQYGVTITRKNKLS